MKGKKMSTGKEKHTVPGGTWLTDKDGRFLRRLDSVDHIGERDDGGEAEWIACTDCGPDEEESSDDDDHDDDEEGL